MLDAEDGWRGPVGRDTALPLLRLLVLFLVLSGFAVGFAGLVHHADRPGARQSAAVRCGEAVGLPCPSRADMD